MMNVKVELDHPKEFEAFARFCSEVAGFRAQVKAEDDAKWGSRLASTSVGPTDNPVEVEVEVETPAPEAVQAVAPDDQPDTPGTPAPAKRKRRTKAEIEADEAAKKAAQAPKAEDLPRVIKVEDMPVQADATVPEIQANPEDRQDPAQAETPAEPEVEPTAENLRLAAGRYVQTYGMAAAQADGPAILEKALGPLPEGAKDSAGKPVTKWCLSAVPNTPEANGKAIKYWNAAIAENPFGRDKVGG